MKAGRNDPCPCGSGRKFKHCCQLNESGVASQVNVAQLMQFALSHHNAGRLDQAEAIYRQLLNIQPHHPEANHNLGILAMRSGRNGLGLQYLEKAWKSAPSNEQFCLALTDCLLTLGRANDALLTIQSAVPHKFNSAQAQRLLQLATSIASGRQPALSVERELLDLYNAGQHKALEDRLAPLMHRYPNWGWGWQILGVALASQNKDAESALRRAVELSPNDAQAHNNWANSLQSLGRLGSAVVAYRRAVELKPDYVEAYYNLGNALYRQGELGAAQASFHRALEINPDHAEAQNNFGNVLRDKGELGAAEARYRRAIALKPDFSEAHNNLGSTLLDRGQLDAAQASIHLALKIEPFYADAHNNLGNVLKNQGDLAAAEASYRRALELDPGFGKAYSNLLTTMQYAEGHTQAESYSEHLAYARRFEAPLKGDWLAHANPREPGKRLRVGYVSPDFRNHSVAYFIEPVLAHHDRERAEVYCYYNHSIADEVTLRLKGLVEHWRDIGSISDDTVAKQIREDGIDVLVDLAGHTAGNRLGVFARKPAPVQATWLGYLCTTGLSAMDYRISDAYADPIGMSEAYYSETLYRLPDTFVCYHPPKDAPRVGALPAIEQRGITFGSFNNLAKITDGVRELWTRVLQAVPGARLSLKTISLADTSTRLLLIDDFARRGVGEERLMLASHDATHFEHLSRYNQVDIGLDPFPCNGGTTSFDAMWMGVPVVTLAGNSFISRMGVSMLTSLGLTELVAQTPEDYVAIAARLARDLDRLAALRAGLRERMADSPLTDAKRFTLNLEQAYREMWVAWCGRSRVEVR